MCRRGSPRRGVGVRQDGGTGSGRAGVDSDEEDGEQLVVVKVSDAC